MTAQATALLTSIHKISNPKPPKQPDKRSKKPPVPHLAADCGFPGRDETETALLAVNPMLDVKAAMEMLKRVHVLNGMGPRKDYPSVERADVLWACDPRREAAFLKVRIESLN